MELDEIDMKILSALLDNCRESDRQIGKKIGITGSATKNRIKKMLKNKTIEKFTLKIEPPILGFNVIYLVVSGQDIDKILNQIKKIGEVFFIVPCIGDITVCSIVTKENVQEKIKLIQKIMKDVKILTIFEAENPGIRSDLTKTDLQIIENLLINPRKKIQTISHETKLSTKTITRSLEKLQNDEAVLFTLVYNPIKLEHYLPYVILTWINKDMDLILNKFNKEFSKSFLQKPFIAKNQIVLFLYSNSLFKLDKMTQLVRKISGVDSASLFIPKSINFPQKWIINSIKKSKTKKKLHLMYQTN